MSEGPRAWRYLERRPGSSYEQLCVKGKRIWAWTLYSEFMNEKEPRTPQQLAEDFAIPLEAVQEAIAYCQSDPPELREDLRTVTRGTICLPETSLAPSATWRMPVSPSSTPFTS